MKIACVVQRFGADVAGGAEAHCRALAARLAKNHQVEILTSTAKDYITWQNEYPEGTERDGNLEVKRFKTLPRKAARFREQSATVFSGLASSEEEAEWFRSNGPEMPDLLQHLSVNGRDFDLVLFWSYRYYHAFFGLPLVADRAVLVPTAEEDPAIQLGVLSEWLLHPRGYLYLTPEERALVESRMAGTPPPCALIGTGLDEAPNAPSAKSPPKELTDLGVREPYGLYLGRVDPNKGCHTLFAYFEQHLQRGGRKTQLVLAGKEAMDVPDHPDIRSLGFVSEALREQLLAHCALLFMPSPFESLSMVLLEAWNHGRPALVNGCCRVLKGQVRRADGGLYYMNSQEFSHGLDLLLESRELSDRLGAQGLQYVERNYRWEKVMETTERFLQEIKAGPR